MIAPYRSFGVERVVAGKTGGTDHVPFAELGLPAFQFIQDPLDTPSRAHHSSVDTFDHLKKDDLRQAAIVLAGLLIETANRPDALPRNPLPAKPNLSDPFAYPAP